MRLKLPQTLILNANIDITLEDTEDVLIRDQIHTNHEIREIREIYEAKNLARAIDNPDSFCSLVGLMIPLKTSFSFFIFLKLFGGLEASRLKRIVSIIANTSFFCALLIASKTTVSICWLTILFVGRQIVNHAYLGIAV